MDWNLTPENQKKYDEVVAHTRRLQAELGIKPRTIEERARDYAEKQKQVEELKKLMSNRRPPPKWKL